MTFVGPGCASLTWTFARGPSGHYSVLHCHSPVMTPICFGLSLQCDCFFIYLLPKYLLNEPALPSIKSRACVSSTSRNLLSTLYLTSPPPTAHSCGGQYIWGLLLWSAVGSEADQCPFSSGAWGQPQVGNNICKRFTTSHQALFLFFLAGAVQYDREPHQLHQPVQSVLHP